MESLFRTKIFSMDRAFKHWIYMNKVGRIVDSFNDEKKKDTLRHLILFKRNNGNEKKRNLLEKFYLALRMKKIKIIFFE